MSGWLPIETAPRDGTAILTYEKYDEPRFSYKVYYWHERGGWTDGEYGGDPTHWMPLPEPPTP